MNNHNRETLGDIRERNPLIHHITNEVVMNFTANGLLSFGGSPIMAKDFEEMAGMISIADGLLINIGTIVKDDIKSMIKAGQEANKRNIPVVLDPVGVAATPFRTSVINQLLTEISFTAIKGNAGEMAHLVNIPWQTKGVESIDNDTNQLKDIAINVANKFNTIAIVTGEIDVICEKGDIRINKTGHHYLTKVTGAGCLLGSIITAYLTSNLQEIDSTYNAVHFYGKAAEFAANQQGVFGTGTFTSHFIDALGREYN